MAQRIGDLLDRYKMGHNPVNTRSFDILAFFARKLAFLIEWSSMAANSRFIQRGRTLLSATPAFQVQVFRPHFTTFIDNSSHEQIAWLFRGYSSRRLFGRLRRAFMSFFRRGCFSFVCLPLFGGVGPLSVTPHGHGR